MIKCETVMTKANRRFKHTGRVITFVSALAMFATIPTKALASEMPTYLAGSENVSIYEVFADECDPIGALKQEVISKYADVYSVAIEEETAELEVSNTDFRTAGVYNASLSFHGITEDNEVLDFTENAAVHVKSVENPVLVLTDETVTITNSTVEGAKSFDFTDYIDHVTTNLGNYPVLRETDDVKQDTDGSYTAVITAIDELGKKSEVTLNVIVKTPEEVLRAREEAARKEAEEIARREAEEKAAAQRAAQQAAAVQYSQPAVSAPAVNTSGANPYTGGWSNCTWGAWQAAYNSRGIALPQWGNAGGWLYSASSMGYGTGSTPVAGCIAVYSGHVAYVASVSADGSQVYIIEGGYLGRYNERWVSAYGCEQALQGYIYF